MRRPTGSRAADDLNLRVLVAAQKSAPQEMEAAAEYFEKTTKEDRNFADAFAAWANMYVIAAGTPCP